MTETEFQVLRVLLREIRANIEELASEVKSGNSEGVLKKAETISFKASQIKSTVITEGNENA